ncbi:MAG: hypothetical protein AB7O65_12550 [Candidatus Korobacteraceae bacterium]
MELCETQEHQLAEACQGVRVHHEDDGFWEYSLFQDGSARALWRNHFEFAVSSDGSRVLWRRCTGVSDEVLFTYLLGQVLSFCLLARGIEPLHATSVVVDGKAIAFLGNCGYGKSTLASVFLSRGYPLLTDDVLVLEFGERGVLAYPSIPRLKLLPESADAFFQGRRSIPMNTLTNKMIFALSGDQHVSHPVPLAVLYMVPPEPNGESISIGEVEGQERFIALIKSAFNDSVLTPARLQRQFAFANRLRTSVPVKRLSHPRRLGLVPEVADAILADLMQEALSP